MPIITNRRAVLAIYAEAAARGWVLPCFCSENLTTTEAILAASLDRAHELGIPDLPVIVAITNQYDHRTQSVYYTQTRRWDIGLKLFMADLQVLAGRGSPFENLRIMIHLDHTQFDDDQELLGWDLSQFSSIMFDASKVSFAENIRLTRQFVEAWGDRIVIEGACDEIVDATGSTRSDLTTADKAEEYLRGTGVDLIVANLGTEHRATGKDLRYYGDHARQIRDRIGTRIVLHGASSVPADQLADLINDGICKVNLWTALERDTTPVLFKDMVRHACEVAGSQTVSELKQAGLLGESCLDNHKASIAYFTTTYRQTVIFEAMKDLVHASCKLWLR